MKLLLEYSENSSYIHKLDPRVKLLWLIGNLILILSFQELTVLIPSLGLVLITTILAGISLTVFLPLVKVMSIIGIQFILFQGLLRPEGVILFQLGNLNFYLGGVLIGIQGIALLITLVLLFLQFVMWTSPNELTLLCVKLGLPQKYAVLLGLALHFLPIMEKDLQMIYESQQARGLELETTWQKAKGLVPIILPLILRSLKRSQEIALSMELKGYNRFSARTFLSSISFSSADYFAFGFLVIYFCGLIFLQIV
ncbi:energy-coupling factor transporter transmembrane component T family protein [Geosporobacter ferrireducens]|uniref:Cobalt transporter n=1 Tax=Geosporobacter ferrireducens TaxID=1424294 RepID=A0A1D8GM89_9FIRM|nr:energy-coupling factor transporter transmembrane component T [Geosporobacter ferrireducens]AOT72038.1 hypothetical protein Gferi_22370 [Geosporobacter ferrireducens]